MNSPNEALRAHVTSARFVLTLGATHIAALVHIERSLRHGKSQNENIRDRSWLDHDPPLGHPLRPAFRNSVSGMNGLIARGLAVHTTPQSANWRPSDIWTITPAGWAVITLLVEAGIWAEYADALPAPKPPSSRAAKQRRADTSPQRQARKRVAA